MKAQTSDLKEQILDSALKLAEKTSWERMRLSEVASDLQLPLDTIYQYYLQKDDLVEAWFDRADQAMLKHSDRIAVAQLPIEERISHVIMHWFSALASHQRLTRQMLAYKMEFGHIHLQVLGIMRISRTVQWFMEAAALKNTSLTRIIEEVILTNIYLASFTYWMYDSSENFKNTEMLLSKLLSKAYRFHRSFN